MIIYGGELVASGSSTVIPVTGFAVTGSNTFQGNQTINGDITVTGSLTAQQFIVSSSVTYMTTSFASGSTKFGNSSDDTHQFTGSMLLTGSLTVVTNGNEFQVNSGGVNIGNALTDNHVISGSVRINPNGLFVSSSGDSGIGVTNPASKLHVVGDITQQTSLNASAQFFIIARKSRGTVDTPLTVNVGDEAGGIMFQGYDGTSWRSGAVIRAKIQSVSTGVISSDLEFYAGNGSPSVGSLAIVIKGDTRNVGIGSSTAPVYKLEVSTASGSERIRVGTLQNNSNTATFEAITSAGLSTATSGWIRAVYGGGLAIGTSTYTKAGGDSGNFANLSSEVQTTAMTVTSGGVVQIHTASGDAQLSLSAAGATAYVRYTNSSADIWGLGNGFASGTDFELYNFSTSVYAFRVKRAGIYATTATSPRSVFIQSDGTLGGISSIRESKTNINQLDSNWLMQLNPVSFNYRKKDTDDKYTNEHYDELFYGLIAEEAELVNKEICTYNDNKLIGIEYSKLIPVLIKSIQELKAEVELLKNK